MNQYERIPDRQSAAVPDSKFELLEALGGVVRSDLLRNLWAAYRHSTVATFVRFESLLLPICLCGAVGMPIYYFIWTELFPQNYENLTLRLVGGVFCLVLAAEPIWPTFLRRYSPLAWHACLCFCVPFFFSFMTLMNQGSPVWLVTWLCGFFMLVVIVNWMNLVLLLLLGTAAAIGVYEWTAGQTANYGWAAEQIPVFAFALIAGTLASYRRGMVEQERFAGLSMVGRNLTRELNGSLRSVTAVAAGLKQYLPAVLRAVGNIPAAEGAAEAIPTPHLKALGETPARIQHDLQRVNAIMQMLAGNSEAVDWRALPRTRVEINDCARHALCRYPFASDAERCLIKWRSGEGFVFFGDQEMMVRSLMSVMKAGMSSVLQQGRGEIEISSTAGAPFNIVTVLLAGVRIPSRLMPQAFDVQSSLELSSGTGPGLFLAKQALSAWGGDLACKNSDDGESRFEFKLPPAPN